LFVFFSVQGLFSAQLMGSTGFDIGDFWIRLEFFRVFSFTGTGIDIWTEFFFSGRQGDFDHSIFVHTGTMPAAVMVKPQIRRKKKLSGKTQRPFCPI
jgi:hypothetical protein